MSERIRNLAVRVLSALVLLPLLIGVTWIGGLPFALLLAVAAVVGALELTGMFARIGVPEAFGGAVAGLLPLLAWGTTATTLTVFSSPMLLPVLLSVATMTLLVTNLLRPSGMEGAPQRVGVSCLAWLYCGVLIATVVILRLRFGFAWVIVLLVASFANDTLAYFGGLLFGRTLLYPKASPKKTWEGFLGGVVGSVAGVMVAKGAFLVVPQPAGESFTLSWLGCVGLGLGAAVLAPLGDLVESMIKRVAGVKDSGRIIPGHGGLLDRIDALLFVAPWVFIWAVVVHP